MGQLLIIASAGAGICFARAGRPVHDQAKGTHVASQRISMALDAPSLADISAEPLSEGQLMTLTDNKNKLFAHVDLALSKAQAVKCKDTQLVRIFKEMEKPFDEFKLVVKSLCEQDTEGIEVVAVNNNEDGNEGGTKTEKETNDKDTQHKEQQSKKEDGNEDGTKTEKDLRKHSV